jgi:hypothetical protein
LNALAVPVLHTHMHSMSAAKERKKVTVNQKRPVACDGFEGECEGRSHDDNKNQAKRRQKKDKKKKTAFVLVHSLLVW